MNNGKLEKLLNKYQLTESELRNVLKREPHGKERIGKIRFPRKHFKYGYFSDPHIGHEQFKEHLFVRAVKLFKKESVDFILSMGDHLEGMNPQRGQIYELTHLGYDQQIKYATELYNELPVETYGIDGNHDAWYKKKACAGVIVGTQLEEKVKNYTHLGEGEGQLNVGKIKINLFHGNDGTAYAISYKLQKLMESFSGGEKPNIVHSGHYHKALYMFRRNIHGFESGTLCGQTPYMKGRKIEAHMGFGVVDVFVNADGVDRLSHLFYPGYE